MLHIMSSFIQIQPIGLYNMGCLANIFMDGEKGDKTVKVLLLHSSYVIYMLLLAVFYLFSGVELPALQVALWSTNHGRVSIIISCKTD